MNDTLGNITSKIGSGATPRGGRNAYKEKGITLIRSMNVYDFHFSMNGLAFIDEEQAKKLDNVQVKEGDILFNITGDSINRTCIVPKDLLPARVNQHVSIIRCKKGIDSRYVNYYLINLKPYLMQICGVGGTRNALTKEALTKLPIKIHKNHSQIAKTLSDLDAKIELNNKINAELEAMAKLIYDYWFVQFDFPISKEQAKSMGKPELEGKPYKSSGGKTVWNEELKREVPEGWRSSTIKSWIGNDKSGDWGKASVEGNYVKRVSCIRGADINGLNGTGEVKAPTRFILEKNDHKILDEGDLVVEISGGSPTQSTGRLAFIIDKTLERFEDPLICSNFCKALTLKEHKSLYNFVYLWNRLYDEGVLFGWEGKTSGIKNLLFDSFVSNYEVVLPPKDLMEKFYEEAHPIHSKIQKNLEENKKLAEFRDWLLPMLMNGQVKVSSQEESLNMAAEASPAYKKPRKVSSKQIENYKKIQVLYSVISANKQINVKQGEMATAKDVYLLDRISGIDTGFQFAQNNWGAFDPKEKQLLNTKQYFHKPNFPNSKAFYLDLKDNGKLLDKIPEKLKSQVSQGIQLMNDKVFKSYFGTQKATKKELFATILKCIEDEQTLELSKIRTVMKNWKIKQKNTKWTNKAEKFSEEETKEALEVILRERWHMNVFNKK